jgi:hypothetical protein
MASRHRGPSAGSVLVLPSAPPAPSPSAAFCTRPAAPNPVVGRRGRNYNQSGSTRSGKASLSSDPWSPPGTMRMSSLDSYDNTSDTERKTRGSCSCCSGTNDGIGCKGRCLKCIARCAKALLIAPNLLFMVGTSQLLWKMITFCLI